MPYFFGEDCVYHFPWSSYFLVVECVMPTTIIAAEQTQGMGKHVRVANSGI